jgi:hypothetical protein
MVSFVETKLFTRLVQEYLSESEYPKSVMENIPAHLLRQIRKEIDDA